MIHPIRRLGALAALVLLIAAGTTPAMTLLDPATADAQTPGNSAPYPGNPHWHRYSGLEAVVQIQIDASAKALRPLVEDAVYTWNNRFGSPYMHLQLLAPGDDCYGVTNFCVVVAENNSLPCTGGESFLQWDTTSFGHLHFKPALLTVNLLDCNVTLLHAKFLMCHEFGHVQGVGHDPTGIRPCSPGDGLTVLNDVNVRNLLGATPG